MSPSRGSHVSTGSHSRASKPALVIPRAKVTPSRGYTNNGYHSDDDRFSSPVEVRIVKYLIDVMNVVFRTTEPCLRWSPRVADTGGGQSPPSPPVCWEAGRGGRAVWTHCWRASSQMEETAPGDSLTPPSTGQCPEETWTQWTGTTN